MTTISAKVIADSISAIGVRLTTIQLRYPRFIHAENKTHRMHVEHGSYIEEYGVPTGLMYDPNISRNGRSSRAVPVPRMIQEVMDDPVVPIRWGKAQPGMQAYEEHDALVPVPWIDFEPEITTRGVRRTIVRHPMPPEQAWLNARDKAVEVARAFHEAGYHKQVINRLLEPFMHIDTLVTATNWSNWFALRDHHAAEPHIEKLAQEMRSAIGAAKPKYLQHGEWHLPYADRPEDHEAVAGFADPLQTRIKLSVARCARISYAPFDGDASIEKELERYDLLVGSQPLHASPAEHQATPDLAIPVNAKREVIYQKPHLSGNLKGWIQYRKTLPGECVR